MSIEIILLAISCGITLLAYLIAINAHGPTRLSLSYFLATVMLAGNVWGIIKYVNEDKNSDNIEALKRLEAQNRMAEEKLIEQEKMLKIHKEKIAIVSSLNSIISNGSSLSATILNANLQDESLEIDALIARANSCKDKIEKLKNEFQGMKFSGTYFNDVRQEISAGIEFLVEASNYYRNYYYAEDSQQELSRERLLRQKAKLAHEKFKSASMIVSNFKE